MEDPAPYGDAPEGEPFDPEAGLAGLSQRIRQLPSVISQHLGVRLSARAFAAMAGSNAQKLSTYGRGAGGSVAPITLAQGIAARYPYVSLRWLLLGEGEPIEPWASTAGVATPDVATSVLRLAAERGVRFDRLVVEQVDGDDGERYVTFDAAGRMRA